MEIVIESAKQTLERSSTRSSKYNRKRAKFNYRDFSGNVIIRFLLLIFVAFEKSQVKSESTPYYWLTIIELITGDPRGHLKGTANLG